MTRFRFDERSSGCIEFDIVDREGVAVPAANLTTAELTLFDWETGAGFTGESPKPGIINNRDAQDVLNTNNVAIDADGHVIWSLQPDDNIIVNPRRQIERHRAVFRFTWPTGSFPYEIEIEVVNLRNVA